MAKSDDLAALMRREEHAAMRHAARGLFVQSATEDDRRKYG